MASHRRLRVLLLLTSTAGGVGLHAYYLARDLPKDAFDVTVGYGPGYPMDRDIESLGVPVQHFSISRQLAPLTNLRGFFQVLSLLRSQRFDIVCTECSIAGLIGRVAGWLARVPVRIFVIQLHASHPNQSKLKQWVYRQIERTADWFTTHYVAVSEAMKTFGVEHRMMRAERVTVIYNGIVLSEPMPQVRARVRREMGLRPDSLVVGSLARLEPQKGLRYMLEAAARVRQSVPNVAFVVAGEGPLRDELEAMAKRLGVDDCVHLVGWRSDVAEVLSSIDVFCLPSLWESFGIALAEAMAMERPIVASAVDGIPEVVKDGETGILVPPRNPGALAAALVRLLQDPQLRERMGKAGRERAIRMFGVEEMVDRYAAVFRDLSRQASPQSAPQAVASGETAA